MDNHAGWSKYLFCGTLDLPHNHCDDSFGAQWVAASPEDDKKTFIYPQPAEAGNVRKKSTDIRMESFAQRTVSLETVLEKPRSSSTGSAIGKLILYAFSIRLSIRNQYDKTREGWKGVS